ncbi:MAG TPA: PIN domain-containing protein [Fimbriimonas sp.]|nr:PIN domain-containing protein [Fimbriimonas sp.]
MTTSSRKPTYFGCRIKSGISTPRYASGHPDTDIVFEILKGRNGNVKIRKIAYIEEFQQFSITSATILEILAGYRKRGALAKRERAEAIFEVNVEIVPESADFRLAADIIGDLLIRGRPIGVIDPIVASCAIRRGRVSRPETPSTMSSFDS